MPENKTTVDPYSTLETDGKLTLFVNSLEGPHEEIPLNHYRYNEYGDGITSKDFTFFRLFRIVYLREDAIQYSLLDWKEVKVKEHCTSAMKQFVDSLTAAKELLVE